MRHALHALLTLVGLVPWSAAMVCMWLTMRVALLCELVMPNARWGNCWSFTLPLWRQRGGYLTIRPSPPPFTFIPHAIWVESLDGCTLQQSVPRNRAKTVWQAWRSIYFPFRVVSTERRPGDTKPAPLE